jgi:hypothetical protein
MLDNFAVGIAVDSSTASTAAVSVSDSIISGTRSGDRGIVVSAGTVAGARARAYVTRCTIEAVDFALFVATDSGGGMASMAISYSTVFNNGIGWYQVGTGSSIRTLGNNHITDNDGSIGSLTSTPLQ